MTVAEHSTSPNTADLLKSASRRLVETGARNRLVHVNRSARRSNTIAVINERADFIFELLKLDGRKMKFLATAKTDEGEQDELELSQFLPTDEVDESRLSDRNLETPLTLDRLQKSLLKIAREARTAEEEQGVNILYLAIGFLRWFESESSSMPRESPLILLPVELIRNERTFVHDIQCRDEDIVTNLPLQERLRVDFGVELPEISDDDDWRPSSYFQKIRDRLSGHPRWSIDGDGMQLGFFSFSKLLMLRDLDPENWPDGALSSLDLVQKLLIDGFEPQSPMFEKGSNLDKLLETAELMHVVESDASQAKVIEEVRTGRNLVVQGPPGTGKSQTISNILAVAAFDGKKILFIAEKMAALQVVHKRMADNGLGDLCLELHSKFANKKAFLFELRKTLSNAAYSTESSSDHSGLKHARDELNRINDILHTRVPGCEYTPFEAISSVVNFIGREVTAPTFSQPRLAEFSSENICRIRGIVERYAGSLAKAGNFAEHPFFGVENLQLQPTDRQRLDTEIGEAVASLDDLLTLHRRVADTIGLKRDATFDSVNWLIDLLKHAMGAPESAGEYLQSLLEHKEDFRFCGAIAAGSAWQEAKSELSEEFTDIAWQYRAESIRSNLAKSVGSIFPSWSGRYRSASSELSTLLSGPIPKSPRERLALVDRLMAGQSKLEAFKDDEDYLKSRLGDGWRAEKTDFHGLNEVLNWLSRVFQLADLTAQSVRELLVLAANEPDLAGELAQKSKCAEQALKTPAQRLEMSLAIGGAANGDQPISRIVERLGRIRSEQHRYEEWVQLQNCRNQLNIDQLDELAGLLENQVIKPEQAVDEYLYATAEARWNRALSEMPQLMDLARIDRHDLVESFKSLDSERSRDAQREIRNQHLAQMPKGAFGEMAFLRGEMAKKTRHHSIRRIMKKAGSMVQKIKPIFMMSPISVAQYLPPGILEFDLLVIDEASQVRPEEALGAIARAGQIVVVGDQKQLPPTSFFDRLADDAEFSDDETDQVSTARAEEMESILTLCEARGLGSSMLEYHYRSRDPSLMTVSNKEFYDDRLVLPPSPHQKDDSFGLKFTQVQGVYSSRRRGGGRPGTNRLEAEAVAKALADHARSSPSSSVGIVTFSKAQADIMTEVLELARRKDPVLDNLLREEFHENVFVKNIENVQGDERDVILITVGYGPHEPGGPLLSMNFGPVNNEGGERRLNVLFTRARLRCEVFTSFDPREIDLTRTKREGPRVLKRFLEFARSGELAEKLPTGDAADSPFEADVAREIESLGYPVDHQVGSAGFKIDLGVRHPERRGRYILAVECDGARYHSALWARERDRHRQAILEGFGWQFHRIWSTDWFYNRMHEIDRLSSALGQAAEKADHPMLVPGTNRGQIEQTPDDKPADIDWPTKPPELQVPAYKRSDIQISTAVEHLENFLTELAVIATSIVEIEGPIHTVEVARRIARGLGKTSASPRIKKTTKDALQLAEGSHQIKRSGEFWLTQAQEQNVPIRDRSQEPSITKRPEYVSEMEFQAAAALIRSESGHVDTDELVRAISRLLGYKRAGPKLRSRVKDAL